MPKRAKLTNGGVDRALILLEWLAHNADPVGVREVARALNLQKSTVHRLLDGLSKRGWVRQTQDDKYRIGLKVLELASIILSRTTLLDVAAPIARELAQRAGEAVYIGVREINEVVIVHKVGGVRGIRFEENVGTRACLHTTAIGKAILAALPDEEVQQMLATAHLPSRTPASIRDRKRLLRELAAIRLSGIAESDEENYLGALGTAAAIRNQAGEVQAAITIAGLKSRMLPRRHEFGRLVAEAADRISVELGFGAAAKKAHSRSRSISPRSSISAIARRNGASLLS